LLQCLLPELGWRFCENIHVTAGGLISLAVLPVEIPESLRRMPHETLFTIDHLQVHGFLKFFLRSMIDGKEGKTKDSWDV
jgi:hypothetical protein